MGLVDLKKDSNSGSTVNLNEPVELRICPRPELIPEGPKFVLNWVGLVLMVENVSQFESGLLGSFGCTRPTNQFCDESALNKFMEENLCQ